MVFESLLGTPCPFSQEPHQRGGQERAKRKNKETKATKGREEGREFFTVRMKKIEQTRVTCPPKAQSTALGNQFQ